MMSERLPGKPLKKIRGMSIIQHCFVSAKKNQSTDSIFIATPDPDISWEATERDIPVVLTSVKPVNGTERVAEVARILQLEGDDIVVNLQGDMPFFDPEIIDESIERLKAIPECNMASVMALLEEGDLDNPNKVKVRIDGQGRAIDFSRKYGDFLHIGVYVFRNEFLQKYDRYGSVAKERRDHLEQQRIIYMGEPIHMAHVNNYPTVIDTQEDLEKAQ